MSDVKIGWSKNLTTKERRPGMLLPSGNFVTYDPVTPFAATWREDEFYFEHEAFDPKSNPEDVFIIDKYGHVWVYGPTVKPDYDGWINLNKKNYGASHVLEGTVVPKQKPTRFDTVYSFLDEEPMRYYILKDTDSGDIYKWDTGEQKWRNTKTNVTYTWAKLVSKDLYFTPMLKEPNV